MPFRTWWDGESIYQFGHKKIRRCDLILHLGTDGTSAAGLPPEHRSVIDGQGWKATLNPGQGTPRDVTLHDAHLASIRQVAHEILKSPELLKLAGRPA